MNEGKAIFISGRQHCGNTMLSVALDRHSQICCLNNEGKFFEHWPENEKSPGLDPAVEVLDLIARSGGPEIGSDDYHQLLAEVKSEALPHKKIDLYKAITSKLSQIKDKTLFAQKATSYIFCFKNLLNAFDEVKFIYIIRNPYDLAASIKRRILAKNPSNKSRLYAQWLRMLWGWKMGGELAVVYAQSDPDSFRIVHYEDFVGSPESEMRELCTFLNIEFEEEMLDIPHVNKSENQFKLDNEVKGIQQSRVSYYKDLLTPKEIAFISMMMPKEAFAKIYPQFSDDNGLDSYSGITFTSILMLVAGAANLGWILLFRLIKAPLFFIRYIKRRLS